MPISLLSSTQAQSVSVAAAGSRRHRRSHSNQQEGSRPPAALHGLLLATALGLAALWMGRWAPIVGGPVFGIVLGMIIRNSVGVGPIFRPGLKIASRQVLQWSIIALGFGLSIRQVAKTGMESLSVTAVTICLAFGSAYLLGKWLNIPSKLKILIGVGTAICGGSA
ncbi:MAG TPA: putative sulfate exporter family transporter, partial [Paralcaligenes sp.]